MKERKGNLIRCILKQRETVLEEENRRERKRNWRKCEERGRKYKEKEYEMETKSNWKRRRKVRKKKKRKADERGTKRE